MKRYTFGFEAYVSVNAETFEEAEEIAMKEFEEQKDNYEFTLNYICEEEVEE